MATQTTAFSLSPFFTKGMDYETYLALIHELLSEGKTSGPNQQDDLVAYTKLNLQRMERLNKTIELTKPLLKALKKIASPQNWLVITEAWCGDAAQNIPLLAKMAQTHPYIKLKLVLRDENHELMDKYLTHGGRAIPKLIVMDEQFNELYTWGPRPATAQQMVNDFKANPIIEYDAFKTQLHTWYAKNKTQQQQEEFAKIIK
jgi:hypothetical protein